MTDTPLIFDDDADINPYNLNSSTFEMSVYMQDHTPAQVIDGIDDPGFDGWIVVDLQEPYPPQETPSSDSVTSVDTTKDVMF